jgi:hypothetical protein
MPRKNFKNIATFINEPDSRAQVGALEDNVKEFGLTYFGMDDRRQGELLCAGRVRDSDEQVSSTLSVPSRVSLYQERRLSVVIPTLQVCTL